MGAIKTDSVILILETYLVINGASDVPALMAAKMMLASMPYNMSSRISQASWTYFRHFF